MTIPSTPAELAAARTAPPMRSQSAGVSAELSTAINSTASTCDSEPRSLVRSVPLRLGRAIPSASVRVAIVPPVAMTTTRRTADCALVLMRRLFTTAALG